MLCGLRRVFFSVVLLGEILLTDLHSVAAKENHPAQTLNVRRRQLAPRIQHLQHSCTNTNPQWSNHKRADWGCPLVDFCQRKGPPGPEHCSNTLTIIIRQRIVEVCVCVYAVRRAFRMTVLLGRVWLGRMLSAGLDHSLQDLAEKDRIRAQDGLTPTPLQRSSKKNAPPCVLASRIRRHDASKNVCSRPHVSKRSELRWNQYFSSITSRGWQRNTN